MNNESISVTRQRLTSVTSLGKKSNFGDKNDIENEALEEDQMNAGWSVLLKYFEV